jgi:hypothetical protein
MRDININDIGKKFLVCNKRTKHFFKNGEYPVYDATFTEFSPSGEFLKRKSSDGWHVWDRIDFLEIVEELEQS